MTKYNGFIHIATMKPGETFEFINFMSPGKDKPIELVYWDKCILASLCCGLAPTEEQFNESSYNQINITLIKKNIIPLLYLLLKEINKYGDFSIIKTSKENKNLKLKNGNTYYLHYLSIIRNTPQNAKEETPSSGESNGEYENLEMTERNYEMLCAELSKIEEEILINKKYMESLNERYMQISKVLNEMGY